MKILIFVCIWWTIGKEIEMKHLIKNDVSDLGGGSDRKDRASDRYGWEDGCLTRWRKIVEKFKSYWFFNKL